MPRWLWAAPTIVAERLASVADPLPTGLAVGPAAEAATVAASLAHASAPAAAPCPSLSWLRPAQVPLFRQAIAALIEHHGALLAEPVGSGKTYISLAVAAAVGGLPIVFAPAALTTQWRRVAAQLGVAASVHSHEAVSRGRLPPAEFGRGDGLVIVDESHHYRNPLTLRYGHLARWLVGKRVLLVTATPVLNRLADLAHQLRLCLRDDALRAHGVASLSALLTSDRGAPALGAVIVGGSSQLGNRPVRSTHDLEPRSTGNEAALLGGIDRLRLSSAPAVELLIRSVLWQALASSPAAVASALQRYRRLLLHARDANEAGKQVSRAALLRMTDGLDDQLLFWPLLSPGHEQTDLALGDLADLDDLLVDAAEAAEHDPKLAQLRTLLEDGRCTLVFSRSRATVHYLRRRLGHSVAWCTGERAGIGTTSLPRQKVLDWFGPSPPLAHGGPRVLVSTDVAAEGLDLPAAERVVHYDLPWTAARLDQREGRAVRAGSPHRRVVVVRFPPSPELEQRLRQSAILERKAALPRQIGLGREGRALWRWQAELAERCGDSEGAPRGASAMVTGSSRSGILAGYEVLELTDRSHRRVTTVLGWIGADGEWSEAAGAVTPPLLEALASERAVIAPTPADLYGAVALLSGPIHQRLRLIRSGWWNRESPVGSATGLLRRLRRMAQAAARERRHDRLRRIDQALALAAGGTTAGESELLAELADQPDDELARALFRLPPPTPQPGPLEARLVGIVLFSR